MAMEVRGNGSTYKNAYADRMQAEQQKAQNAESGQKADQAAGQKPTRHDEYISSEKSGEKPNGLYHVGQDENGSRKIYYNDPKKAGRADGADRDDNEKTPNVNGDGPDNGEEKCVANTDKVEREIRELKQKKQKLKQQLDAASGDEKKTKELENKLAQVERELRQKDTDTYRKQKTSFTDK